MFLIPNTVYVEYVAHLNKRKVAGPLAQEYVRWLRIYLEFFNENPAPDSKAKRVRLFMEKLRTENRSQVQLTRAANAVSLYFGLLRQQNVALDEKGNKAEPNTATSGYIPPASTDCPPELVLIRKSQYSDAGYEQKSDSPEWDEALAALAAEIKVRHYSRKTLKTYALWTRKFQRFLRNKSPQVLSTADVKAYLTFLAVKCQVAASTQNQAFNSLLFFFRHALKRDFGELRDVPRARKSLYDPRGTLPRGNRLHPAQLDACGVVT